MTSPFIFFSDEKRNVTDEKARRSRSVTKAWGGGRAIKDEVTPRQIPFGAGAAKITMKMANDCHTLADPFLRVIADTANTCSKCVHVSDGVLA